MTVYQADLLIALGSRAVKRGDLTEAQLDFDHAATAARESHMPRPFADATFHEVEVRERTGDWIGASELIPYGLQADRKLIDVQFLPQHLAEAARIQGHLGNVAGAEEYLSQASDVIEAALVSAPSANVKASLIATMSDVYASDFRLALEQEHNLAKAFSILEKARSQVMADHLRSQVEIPVRRTSTVKALEQQIGSIQLALLSSPGAPAERGKLLRRLDEVESELEPLEFSHDSTRRPGRVAPVPLNVLKNSLTPNEVLVEYVLGSEKSFAIAITKESAHAYTLQPISGIQPAVDQYTREIEDPAVLGESERLKASQLFDAVLAPVQELREKDRVIVVPDGVLNLVGFDSLVDSNGRFLIRSHTVSYSPSATLLTMLRNRPPNSTAHYSLLAFGAPELPNQGERGSGSHPASNRALLDLNGGKIENLKAAAGEVREISSELGGASRVSVGAQATEAEFKREPLSQFEVIHFAAHAFADLHYPERSAIVLSPDRNTGEDGLLQIREIRNLYLRSDLVTLSACDAGLGKAQGIEGIESLVNAFLFAGARSVLASRWSTDDVFAASLMTDVYKNLAEGVPIDDALQAAKLAALQRYGNAARPAYWSAFFVSGDADTTIHVQSLKSNDR